MGGIQKNSACALYNRATHMDVHVHFDVCDRSQTCTPDASAGSKSIIRVRVKLRSAWLLFVPHHNLLACYPEVRTLI